MPIRINRLARVTFLVLCLTSSRGESKNISLDGDWFFVPDPGGTLKAEDLASASQIPVRVPGSWQAELVDRRDYAGVAWYLRSFAMDALPPEQSALLRFGAADYLATVYVNGQRAGGHEGGYLPFEFDVTSLLHGGENQIAVRIADPGAKPHDVVEGIRYDEIPHGKQDWYVQTSGLWQSVVMEIRPKIRLGEVHIKAGADGKFMIHAAVQNTSSQTGNPLSLGLEILDPSSQSIWSHTQALAPGQNTAESSGEIAHPHLWSLSNPALYTLKAYLSSGDAATVHFGFRTFEARNGKFYLNGQPVYLRGALDQDFYPDGLYTPPSLDFLRDEIRQAKALGLNFLRCHVKVPDPRYLQAADETGILVWYEIPNWDKLTAASQRRALQTLEGMVERDWNHPSIVALSILNESWGADLRDASDRSWLKQTYEQARAIVPGWLVDDNSACCENFHLSTDIADFHEYRAIPDFAADFDRFVSDLATRPGWLFSSYGDARARGDEPLVLSEFGNWGLARLHEPEPWWFASDFGGNPLTRPEGVRERFADHDLAPLFTDYDALALATQHRQFQALKYEIQSLRMHPEIQGYVITEFTDIVWESNGLLDMWRQPKLYAEELSRLQQDDLVIVRADKRNLETGDLARANLYFSHYSSNTLTGAQVNWQLEGSDLHGSFALEPVPPDSVAPAGEIEFPAPSFGAPAKKLLRVRVVSGAQTLSENSLAFYFYPPREPELPPPAAFHDPAGRLRRLVNEMRDRNYMSPSGSEAFPILISSRWDEEVKRRLGAGGIVILLPSDPQILAPGLEIAPRLKDLEGNWISNFLWVRKNHEIFKAIGFDTLPGFETSEATPALVLKGIPAQYYDDVLAGMFYGWVRSNVAIVAQARCGKGKLIICTFSLSTSYGTDPYSTYLLDGLLNYAVSGFTPRFEVPLLPAAATLPAASPPGRASTQVLAGVASAAASGF